jgi:hypothetical protein
MLIADTILTRGKEGFIVVHGPFEHFLTYLGLSTDTKPTIGILPGTKFYEKDTGLQYIYSGTAWIVE